MAVIQKLEARLAQNECPDPIAFIGAACRFPGAESPSDFWSLLSEGQCVIGALPTDRWKGESAFHRGGFLSQVSDFDAHFFHISPREAERLDPQQRLLLELAWEALEKALIVPSSLRGSNTGVFVGMGAADYGLKTLYSGEGKGVEVYDGTGNTLSFASGRLAYTLDLRGPCLTTVTACSSSLVAIHLAAQSLRQKECNLAICGGVSLILEPDNGHFLVGSQALSPTGQCRPFDAGANGFVRGEGCGVVLLKRLSEAQRDGNLILGVLQASVVNSDGASAGLAAPNGEAQTALIQRALQMAGLDAQDLGYLECHGTGTNLGDPIEVEALGRALAGRKTALSIGSLKANIGHLEGAAGMASLIKALLILEHEECPPQINFSTPNPHVDWERFALRVDTEKRKVAPVVGISGFGMSGTNAHLIVSKAPEGPLSSLESVRRPFGILALSARAPGALKDLAARYAALARTAVSWSDLCASAASGREHLDYRLAVVAQRGEDASAALESFLQGRPHRCLFVAEGPRSTAPKVAFLFTGQGSQRASMGQDLLEVEPAFARSFQALQEKLEKRIPTLRDAWQDQGELNKTLHAQPALFALELALAQLWQDWGVRPSLLFGHSVGEVSAATVGGIFGVEEGAELIAQRAKGMQALASGGGMTAVQQSAAALGPLLSPGLSVAAVSGPRLATISGPVGELETLEESLEERGIVYQRLPVSHAFHSSLLDPCLAQLLQSAERAQPRPATLPLVSNLSGELNRGEMSSATYWVDQARQAVQGVKAMNSMKEEGIGIFLELGPSPTLLSMARRCLPDLAAQWVPSLRPGEQESESVTRALAQLYVAGVDIHWSKVFPEGSFQKVDLPTYPWQRRRFWAESRRHGGMLSRLEASGLLSSEELAKVKRALKDSPKEDAPSVLPAYELAWTQVFDSKAEREGEVWILSGSEPAVLRTVEEAWGQRQTLKIVSPEPELLAAALREHGPSSRLLYFCQGPEAGDSQDCYWDDLVDTSLLLTRILDRMPQGKLHLVTRNAGPSDNSLADWKQAGMWGFAHSVALEFPSRWGGVIDSTPNQDWSMLSKALDHSRVALRESGLWTPQLQARSFVGKALRIDPSKTYLITGGLGDLGLEAAHALADLGARKVILMSRRARSSARLQSLEARGVHVTVHLGDIAQANSLRELPPLHGVLHTAGVVDDAFSVQLDRGNYDTVLRPKIAGLWNLARHFGEQSLDFFVLFSSGAAWVGTKGQANYCAANAAMAALGQSLRSPALPLSVLHFGAWELGMAARLSQAHKTRLRESGFRAFRSEDMTRILSAVLAEGPAELMLADVDWERFGQAFPEQTRSGFFPTPQVTVEPSLCPGKAPEHELRSILRLSPEEPLNRHEGFFKMGLDSLMAAEFASRLGRHVGLSLSPSTIIDHPTLAELESYLLEMWEPAASQNGSPLKASLGSPDQSELERRLEAKFQSILGS